MADTVTGLPGLGATYFGGSPPALSAVKKTLGIEGYERSFKDEAKNTAAPGSMLLLRSGRLITARLVRNVSGFALTPGRAVAWATGHRGRRVAGHTATTNAEIAGIVDPFLPSAGVADLDLFWIIREGPVLLKTPLDASAAWAEGDFLYALTAATTGATTAGRCYAVTAAATSLSLAQVAYRIGRVLTARTAANTNTDTLVDLMILG